MSNKTKPLDLIKEGYKTNKDYQETIDHNEKQKKATLNSIRQRVLEGIASPWEYFYVGYQLTEKANNDKTDSGEGLP